MTNKKTYLFCFSLLGCTALYGAIKTPNTGAQATQLAQQAHTSTDVKHVEQIQQALSRARTGKKLKYPNQLNKVNERLQALRPSQPAPTVSPADQKTVSQLKKQLASKEQEIQAAQQLCQQASQDQAKTIERLTQEIASLKQQCRKVPAGPPTPPPDFKPGGKVSAPPAPPPLSKQEKPKAPAGRANLLESIRKGTALTPVTPVPSKKPADSQGSLLEELQKRRVVVESPEDEENDEDEDWV